MISRFLSAVLLGLLMVVGSQQVTGARERPYFMPPSERGRLHDLISKEVWARADLERLRKAASSGDGFAAAFLYALDGQPSDAATAQQWLLEKYGKKAYWTVRAADRLNSDFFKGGQVGIPEVYYDTDTSGYLAFDWAYKGLEAPARKEIEEGIVLWSRYKMRAMDRWTQTANLVFKPTATVALAGLATDSSELIEWGFRRTRPWGARLGGYDVVLDTMLKDGGPWHEAPIYPISHEVLLMIARLSRWRGLYEQKDWFGARYPSGGSGKGLMDYYIDTAYPIERTGHGAGQIRVANYGDGSTGPAGVCLFFIVSGFVIPFALFNGEYALHAFPRFMAKRIVRLEPPYIISIVLAASLWWRFQFSADGSPLDLTPGTAALHLGYLIDIARSLGAAVQWYVPIYWTLAYELQYYVCVALLFPLVASKLAWLRVGSVAFLIAAKYALIAAPAPLFLNYAEYFAFGVVLFQRRVGLSNSFECAILAFILVGCMAIDSWRFAIYGPLLVGVLIVRDINWAPARMLGAISYSLYLTHDTFGMWLRGALIAKLDLGALSAVVVALVASVAFAALFYWVIERPSLMLSRRISYVRKY